MQNEISGLKIAAQLCRAREAKWREYFDKAPPKGFTTASVHAKAFEAMTCAETIEALIDDLESRRKTET